MKTIEQVSTIFVFIQTLLHYIENAKDEAGISYSEFQEILSYMIEGDFEENIKDLASMLLEYLERFTYNEEE